MRKISRPIESPPFLRSARVSDEKRRLLTYLRLDYIERRQRRDNLNDDLFFDQELLKDFEHVFNRKCAFCESDIRGEGRILHLRPVRFATDHTHVDNDYYLWLAFEWRNLFYACSYCAKSKGDQHPVIGDRGAYLGTFDDIVEQENALLIDPVLDDPAKHLRFLFSGYVVPLTDKGRTTVNVFNLNRLDLVNERQRFALQLLDLIHNADSVSAYARFWDFLSTEAPYSGSLYNILKRISIPWLVSPIAGTGDTFVRRFIDALTEANPAQRERLLSIVQEIQDEHRGGGDVQDYAMAAPSPLYFAPRPKSLQAIDKEIFHINISNFKAIEHLKFALPQRRSDKSGVPALMILGENSTGKSSVLAAIALALVGYKEASKFKKFLPGLVHSAGLDRLDQLDETPVDVSIDFHFSKDSAAFVFDPANRVVNGNDAPSTIVLGYGPRRFFDPKRRNHAVGAAARIRTLFDPLATIPYPGDWLRAQTGNRFNTIASALRVVLALDDDDELIVEPDHLAVRASGRVTPIDSLSEGYRSVFVMTVDIMRELLNYWDNLEQAQAVVLIDELETHLHPRWKMQVMTALRRVLPRVQFIVTTHDPLCLRGMDDNEVVVLQRDANGRIVQLDNLPSVRGMTAEQLLTSDYFGLASTADPSTEIELAKLTGDTARHSIDGKLEIAPAASTMEVVRRLVIGDNPTEQIIQEALFRYLENRETKNGELRPKLRAEAVDEVLRALTESGKGNDALR